MAQITPPPGNPPEGFYLNQFVPPPQPPKRDWPISATVTVIILSFVSLISIGVAATSASQPQSATQSASGPRATTTVTKTVEAAPAAAAPSTTTPAAPAGPLTSFGDGTYEIGTAPGLIAPGKYKTTVPTTSDNCYWERLRGLSGQFADIIANDNVDPGTPAIVTISPSDKGFTSRGCGTWTKS